MLYLLWIERNFVFVSINKHKKNEIFYLKEKKKTYFENVYVHIRERRNAIFFFFKFCTYLYFNIFKIIFCKISFHERSIMYIPSSTSNFQIRK